MFTERFEGKKKTIKKHRLGSLPVLLRTVAWTRNEPAIMSVSAQAEK